MTDRARAGAAADEGDARASGQEGRQRRQDGQVWQRGTLQTWYNMYVPFFSLSLYFFFFFRSNYYICGGTTCHDTARRDFSDCFFLNYHAIFLFLCCGILFMKGLQGMTQHGSNFLGLRLVFVLWCF